MSYLIAVAFDDMETAEKVRESLKKGQKEGYISLDDSAIVVKDEEGKIHIKNEVDRGIKVGAVAGSLIGLVIFGIFAPLGGLIVGALGGAGVGALLDKGISKDFVNDVDEAMKPGSSAIFFIVRDSIPDYGMALMRQYKGKVIQTTLPEDVEDTLRDNLKSP
jgi:uncharacterized membrane protein